MALCAAYYPLAFKSLFWTYNPKAGTGMRHIPFILRPQQELAVNRLQECITSGKDACIDKSRDEGATWLLLGTFFCFTMFVPDCQFLVGSRKEEYVDKMGDHKTLFAKIEYLWNKLPLFAQFPKEKTHMHFKNMLNNSAIDGEATNENFGAGDRRTAVGLDEFGRVEHSTAQSIKDSIADVTDCVIYNSTHFYGRNHPYANVRYSEGIEIIELPWFKNPTKNYGLYKSPDLNKITILDSEYWIQRYPETFYDLKSGETFIYSDIEWDIVGSGNKPYPFIADGTDELRSPWFDKEEKRRSHKDIEQNIKMNPVGGGDAFFDPNILRRCVNESRKPDITGDIKFTLREDRISEVSFQRESGKRRLVWWGKFEDERPPQGHNYIVGSDISLGTGASNSVACIFDCNLGMKVGRWTCPNTGPDPFAEVCVALCKWIGGNTNPFLIWDGTGGPGAMFDKRIQQLGYSNVYQTTDERQPFRDRKSKRGYVFTPDAKEILFVRYRQALEQQFKSETERYGYINPDEQSIREAEGYVWYDTKRGFGPARLLSDEMSGAKAAHGDICTADALCNIARQDQPKAAAKELDVIKPYSPAWRQMQWELSKSNEDNSRWLN